MRRGTTPTITLTVDADIHEYTVHVALKNGCNTLILENDRLTMSVSEGVTSVTFTLTQEETLSLGPGTASVQVRAIHNGVAVATDIQAVNIGNVIEGGVIVE